MACTPPPRPASLAGQTERPENDPRALAESFDDLLKARALAQHPPQTLQRGT
ncbi:MAG: hypothetical protein M3Y33_16255 [Actinomycetota bacterium]|nr:hypothetical protein [Actinomycetota bacterium]